MQRTRIKICGLTRPGDAILAAEIGADAIGIVMYERAARHVSVEKAREIISVLPPFVTPVALFVDEPPQSILDIAAELNVRHVQLHGEESPDEAAELVGLTVLKAIRISGDSITELSRWRAAALPHVAGFVLETAGQMGGSGVGNNWELIASLKSRGEFQNLRIIAAGGLTPESVGGVVRLLRPWAVDVSSGVEAEPGQKSEKKIRDFIAFVREADQLP